MELRDLAKAIELAGGRVRVPKKTKIFPTLNPAGWAAWN